MREGRERTKKLMKACGIDATDADIHALESAWLNFATEANKCPCAACLDLIYGKDSAFVFQIGFFMAKTGQAFKRGDLKELEAIDRPSLSIVPKTPPDETL